ncbi:MAG: hypothetical protein DWQ40_12635 [Actinobacteria bacterium]|nr:MAG: hypothetical protein DWQ40_12635 [Actinomycetota bacterium]
MATSQDPGCRDAALATALLLGIAIAFMGSGIALINQETCTGACEFFGLGLLYSGGPVSAIFGFFTDGVVFAWPLDIMLWVVLAFWAARMGAAGKRSTWAYVISILTLAIVFGFTLSQFVELAA